MKKKFLPLCFILFIFIISHPGIQAQDYKTGLGIRLQPYFNCISVKHFFGEKPAVEVLLNATSGQAVIEAMYEHFNDFNVNCLRWYFGGGGNIKLTNDDQKVIGVVGIIGIEYTFENAPVNLGLDWKPSQEILAGDTFYPLGFGLSVRFTIK